MENASTEQLFKNFLAMLNADKEDQFAGSLFKFIAQVLEATMELGKDRYTPILNLTVYARHTGVSPEHGENMELKFRPSKIGSFEIHEKLKMRILSAKLKTALAEYGKEAWGMEPGDERKGDIAFDFDIVDSWEGATKH